MSAAVQDAPVITGRPVPGIETEVLRELQAAFGAKLKDSKVLVVEDALFCGACTPRPDPLDLPDIDMSE